MTGLLLCLSLIAIVCAPCIYSAFVLKEGDQHARKIVHAIALTLTAVLFLSLCAIAKTKEAYEIIFVVGIAALVSCKISSIKVEESFGSKR